MVPACSISGRHNLHVTQWRQVAGVTQSKNPHFLGSSPSTVMLKVYRQLWLVLWSSVAFGLWWNWDSLIWTTIPGPPRTTGVWSRAYFPQLPVYIHSCILIHLCYLQCLCYWVLTNHFCSVRCDLKKTNFHLEWTFSPYTADTTSCYVITGSQYTTSYAIIIYTYIFYHNKPTCVYTMFMSPWARLFLIMIFLLPAKIIGPKQSKDMICPF